MMQGSGMGLLFGLGLIGMVWMIVTRTERRIGALLIGACVPFALVYMAYYWAGMGGGGPAGPGRGPGGGPGGGGGAANLGAMRFLVPMVPLFVIAGTFAMAQMVS